MVRYPDRVSQAGHQRQASTGRMAKHFNDLAEGGGGGSISADSTIAPLSRVGAESVERRRPDPITPRGYPARARFLLPIDGGDSVLAFRTVPRQRRHTAALIALLKSRSKHPPRLKCV